MVGRGTGRRGQRLQVAAGVLRHRPPEARRRRRGCHRRADRRHRAPATAREGRSRRSASCCSRCRDYLLGPAGPVLRTLLAGASSCCSSPAPTSPGCRCRARRATSAPSRSARRSVRHRAGWRRRCSATALLVTSLPSARGRGRLGHAAPAARAGARQRAAARTTSRCSTSACSAFGALGDVRHRRRCARSGRCSSRAASTPLAVLAHGASVASDPRGRRVQRAVVVAQVAIARHAAVRHGALPPHRPRPRRAPCSASIRSGSRRSRSRRRTDDPVRWNTFYGRADRTRRGAAERDAPRPSRWCGRSTARSAGTTSRSFPASRSRIRRPGASTRTRTS